MHIIMLATRRGCEDGFTARCFTQGHLYNVADTLARAFIRQGVAIEPSALAAYAASHS